MRRLSSITTLSLLGNSVSNNRLLRATTSRPPRWVWASPHHNTDSRTKSPIMVLPLSPPSPRRPTIKAGDRLASLPRPRLPNNNRCPGIRLPSRPQAFRVPVRWAHNNSPASRNPAFSNRSNSSNSNSSNSNSHNNHSKSPTLAIRLSKGPRIQPTTNISLNRLGMATGITWTWPGLGIIRCPSSSSSDHRLLPSKISLPTFTQIRSSRRGVSPSNQVPLMACKRSSACRSRGARAILSSLRGDTVKGGELRTVATNLRWRATTAIRATRTRWRGTTANSRTRIRWRGITPKLRRVNLVGVSIANSLEGPTHNSKASHKLVDIEGAVETAYLVCMLYSWYAL